MSWIYGEQAPHLEVPVFLQGLGRGLYLSVCLCVPLSICAEMEEGLVCSLWFSLRVTGWVGLPCLLPPIPSLPLRIILEMGCTIYFMGVLDLEFGRLMWGRYKHPLCPYPAVQSRGQVFVVLAGLGLSDGTAENGV